RVHHHQQRSSEPAGLHTDHAGRVATGFLSGATHLRVAFCCTCCAVLQQCRNMPRLCCTACCTSLFQCCTGMQRRATVSQRPRPKRLLLLHDRATACNVCCVADPPIGSATQQQHVAAQRLAVVG